MKSDIVIPKTKLIDMLKNHWLWEYSDTCKKETILFLKDIGFNEEDIEKLNNRWWETNDD